MGNPTSLGIKGGPDVVGRIRQIDEQTAIETVSKLSVQLSGKSGVLQAVNFVDSSKNVAFERKSWWQFGSRSAENRVRTADALKALVERAGLNSEPLDAYLKARDGRAGTKTLSTVLDGMLQEKRAHEQAQLAQSMHELHSGPPVLEQSPSRLPEQPPCAYAPPQPELVKLEMAGEVQRGSEPDSVLASVPESMPIDSEPVPDLIDSSVGLKNSEALNKTHRFAIEFDGPALTAKQFNSLDTGAHRELGVAINQHLADRGLHAPRGMSKIDVNGEPVYCYFDAAGKARAILPKGSDKRATEVNVLTWDLPVHESYLDSYRSVVTGLGKKIHMPDPTVLIDLFADSVRTKIGNSVGVGPEDIQENLQKLNPLLLELLQPLDKGGRMVVQFKIGEAPWVVDLALRAGKKLSKVDLDDFEAAISMSFSPLDAPLPDGAIATSELKKLAPQVSWEKTAYVQINYEKSGIRTTADNAYVKKFTEVEQNKSDFFEHLLANEERSPGISNRMLVGVPTADKKKSISPAGPMTSIRKASIPDARLDELKAAAITAVEDLFTLCRAGFIPPEYKPEHYLLDPDAEKFEIKMIDFAIGKYSDLQKNKAIFEASVGRLITEITACLERKSAKSNALSNAASALIADVQAHGAKRAGTFEQSSVNMAMP